MAKLGIQVSESQFFDISTYAEIVELEVKAAGGISGRNATQTDIDKFLL